MKIIFDWILSHKKLSLAALIILVLFLLIFVFDFYPVAQVNGKLIMARDYHKTFAVAYAYYGYLNKLEEDPMSRDELSDKLRLAAMESVVDDVLVEQKLLQFMKLDEVNQKTDEQLAEMLKGDNFLQEAERKIGVSSGDLKKYFFNKQIRYQILDGRLNLEESNFFIWIDQARKSADVKIFLPQFRWTENGIEAT